MPTIYAPIVWLNRSDDTRMERMQGHRTGERTDDEHGSRGTKLAMPFPSYCTEYWQCPSQVTVQNTGNALPKLLYRILAMPSPSYCTEFWQCTSPVTVQNTGNALYQLLYRILAMHFPSYCTEFWQCTPPVTVQNSGNALHKLQYIIHKQVTVRNTDLSASQREPSRKRPWM